MMENQHYHSIMLTNNDAISSKYSAVRLNYYQDEFIHYFCPHHQRKSPIINRGYYVRVKFINKIIKAFLKNNGKQICNFGAGFDTSYFKFKKQFPQTTWFEIDLEEIVNSKIKIITQTPVLKDLVSDNKPFEEVWDKSRNEIHAPWYHLMKIDLADSDALETAFSSMYIDFTQPTLFLSECVLVYLESKKGNNVIHYCSTHFQNSLFLTYEQILPFDPFGEMMIKNIKQRGCPLKSIFDYPDISTQKERYISQGYQNAVALDMNECGERIISREEFFRLMKLELMDEFEEWKLIQAHYCITIALSTKSNTWPNITLDSFIPKKPLPPKNSFLNKQS